VKVPGIGKKTAERLLLELKGKLATLPGTPQVPATDALNALLALGYSEKEALAALKGQSAGMPLAEAIRAALKVLARS
jgi:Holliday junction DNA helicase RuvA